MPPNTLKGRKDVLVLISSLQLNITKEIIAQLTDLEIDFLTIPEYVFAKKTNEILKCAKLLEDDESVEVYTEIIDSYVNYRYPSAKFKSDRQYFTLPEFCDIGIKDTFVDCGAFVGDTLEEYIYLSLGVFGNIVAFEPDVLTYRAMQARVKRLNSEWALSPEKIKLVNAGVGSKTIKGTLKINEEARYSSLIVDKDNSTGDDIKICVLDEFFANQRIDFLKADIEGFEWNMLHGAEKVIRRDLPKIAVCIYHSPSDLYRILLWLESLNLGYKFSVRHHSTCYFDTVLYAYH